MGQVYRAEDTRLGRKVALKFLPDAYAEDRNALDRFELEARAASSLNHPNICTIYEIDEVDGKPFIAMELLEGKSLDRLIHRSPLAAERLLEIAIQIAEALESAHLHGVIHRDLKPANLFVTNGGVAKVLDFGLAKLAPADKRHASPQAILSGPTQPMKLHMLTSPGSAVGTVAYMSPEQSRGLELDSRSDLFSFGAVLYEAATGSLAFSGNTPAVVFDAILNRAPVPPRVLNPEIHSEFERILYKALEKDRELRYQTAGEMRADLARLRRDTSGRVSLESQPVVHPPLPRQAPGRRWLWILGGVAAAAAVMAGGLWLNGLLKDRAGPTQGSGRLTMLFSSASPVYTPNISRDGKMIVYVGTEGESTDLFVSRVAGGGRVRITSDPAREEDPEFSPDGEKVLFGRLRPGTEIPEVCLVASLGGNVVPLVAGAADPTWSPDGARIAFVTRRAGEPWGLATAASDGTDIRVLMHADGTYPFIRDPAWSPDGKWLSVVRSLGGMTGEIWLAPASGGAPRRVTEDSPGVFSDEPVFSTDGKRIIHGSNRGGATNLWSISLDGRSRLQLTTGAGPDESPSLARDSTIAFVNSRGRSNLLVQDLASGASRELHQHSSFIWAPAFSPDGREIAFSRSEEDGSWHVWLIPAAGGTARQLTTGKLPEIYPRFTPDGRFVLYATWSPGPDRIWKVTREGGPPSALTPERSGDDEYGDISPDGKLLVFARTEGKRTRIYIQPLGGDEARPLTASDSTVPRFSPDGQWVAFSPDRGYTGGVFIVRRDGTQERRVSDTGGWPVWWPDGERLAIRVVGPDGNQRVRVIPIAGGTPQEITGLSFQGTNYPIDISPDGGSIATSGWHHFASEIWFLQPQ